MDYNKEIIQLVTKRKVLLSDYELLRETAINGVPELKDLDGKIKELVLTAAKGGKIDFAALRAMQQSLENSLKNLNVVYPAPHCKVCKDSGLYKSKPCTCVISACINTDSEIGIPLHDFENIDFSLFDETSRGRIEKTYGDVKKIISAYPGGKKSTVVIMGSTGTGKTYLAGCAANLMLNSARGVMALTAFALNNRFLKYHTTFDNGKADYLEPLLDCELLVIDDLGTESILKNVSLEYLYLVINERALKRKLTLITSNLSPDNILNRYGARIYSRLFDKALAYPTILTGKDLRSFK